MDKALIFDADRERGESTQAVLEFLEYETELVCSLERIQAVQVDIEKFDVALLVVDQQEHFASEAFRALKAASEHFPIVAMTDPDTASDVLGRISAGSIATVALTLRNPQLQHAMQQVQIYRDNRHMRGGTRSIELFRNLVGSSGGVRAVRRMIEQVAATDATVLLLGESGTGKEVVARNIHYHSTRRYKPFVPINCGAIPGDLLESELFGHEKGAFTGAITSRRGRFEMATGGTLFLDEIGDMPLAMQVKLLRVLQERTFERVSSNKSLVADARIIAATHSNLEQSIVAGKFREDLFYRLNVFPIQMPPLRERVDDLPLLVSDLINRMENENRGSIRLTHDALSSLLDYPWPGNVRELANLIERLVILYPYGVVDAHDLPEKYQVGRSLREVSAEGDIALSGMVVAAQTLPREGLDLKEYLTNLETQLITQALDECGGVVAHAAKRLHMGRTTLVEKMRKLRIHRNEAGTGSDSGSSAAL